MDKAATPLTKAPASATGATSAASTSSAATRHRVRARNQRKRNRRRSQAKFEALQAERDAHNPAGSKLLRRYAGHHLGTRVTLDVAQGTIHALREHYRERIGHQGYHPATEASHMKRPWVPHALR